MYSSLYGIKSLGRERNNRHVFVPVLHGKKKSRLMVESKAQKKLLVSFLTYVNFILEILHLTTVIFPSAARL